MFKTWMMIHLIAEKHHTERMEGADRIKSLLGINISWAYQANRQMHALTTGLDGWIPRPPQPLFVLLILTLSLIASYTVSHFLPPSLALCDTFTSVLLYPSSLYTIYAPSRFLCQICHRKRAHTERRWVNKQSVSTLRRDETIGGEPASW